MKTFIKLSTVSVLVFLLSGCGLFTADGIVSPGRVDHYQLQEEVKKVEGQVLQFTSVMFKKFL